MDVASSHFYEDGKYYLGKHPLGSSEMIDQISRRLVKYSILSVEDSLAEDDWENWPHLQRKLDGRSQNLVSGSELATPKTGATP